MSKQLFINGNLITLDEKESPLELNFAVNNLAELKDRQAYASNIFKIPDTAENRLACGFPRDGNIIGVQPYRRNTAKIVQEGIEILPSGIAIIQGAAEYISVQVLSGIIGFFDTIDGKNITDLDLSEFQHTWDLQTVEGSQSNDEGYIYPVIDYGALPADSTEIYAQQLRPATFVHTIIDRIIKQAGFTYSGDIFADQQYLSELVAFSNDKFTHGKSFEEAADTNSVSARLTPNFARTYESDKNPVDVQDVLPFSDDSLTDPGSHWDGTEYTATEVVKLDVSVNLNFGVTFVKANSNIPSLIFRIQRSDLTAGWVNVTEGSVQYPGDTSSRTYNDFKLEGTVDLKPTESVRVTIAADLDSGVFDSIAAFNVFAGSSISLKSVKQDVVFGQLVQLEATLPSISQTNFIKDFMQRKGLTCIPDRYKKHISFVNLGLVYFNKYKAKDWTKKFTARTKSVSYVLNGYGIDNYGKFKKDENVDEDLGKGVLTLDNQTLKQSQDVFSSVFAATERTEKLNGLRVALIRKVDNPADNPPEGQKFSIKTEPRILINRILQTVIKITDGTDSYSGGGHSFPYFEGDGLPGLGYAEAFAKFYAEVKRMLYRPFIVKRSAIINEQDIVNLDFTIPIFDNETNEYFYLNEINEYIEGRECEVSLIKLP